MHTSSPPRRRSSTPPALIPAAFSLESARATFARTESRVDRDKMFAAARKLRAVGR